MADTSHGCRRDRPQPVPAAAPDLRARTPPCDGERQTAFRTHADRTSRPAGQARDAIRPPAHIDRTRGRTHELHHPLAVTAVAVGVAVWLVPGIDLIGGTSAWAGIALFALILSLVNISIRPIMQVLSLPVTVLTLGIFYLVVNTLMLYIAAWLANGIFQVGFDIVSFGSAFVASIVISIVSSLMNALVGKRLEALRARKPEGLRR